MSNDDPRRICASAEILRSPRLPQEDRWRPQDLAKHDMPMLAVELGCSSEHAYAWEAKAWHPQNRLSVTTSLLGDVLLRRGGSYGRGGRRCQQLAESLELFVALEVDRDLAFAFGSLAEVHFCA
jgi:hypothetical protein